MIRGLYLVMNKCYLRTPNGKCRIDSRYKCVPSTLEWFDDEFEVCEVDEVCRNCSPFGNSYIKLTENDIEQLRQGKVLYQMGEYGTFIALEGSTHE